MLIRLIRHFDRHLAYKLAVGKQFNWPQQTMYFKTDSCTPPADKRIGVSTCGVVIDTGAVASTGGGEDVVEIVGGTLGAVFEVTGGAWVGKDPFVVEAPKQDY